MRPGKKRGFEMTRRIMTAFVACGLSAMPCYAQTIGEYTIGVGATVVSMADTEDFIAPAANDDAAPDVSGCWMSETSGDDGTLTLKVEC